MKITKLYVEYKRTNSQSVYSEFYRQLKAVLYSKLRDDFLFNKDHVTEFDDIFQEVLIKLFIKDNFDESKGTIVNYIYRIFKNKVVDVKRKEFRYPKISLDAFDVY